MDVLLAFLFLFMTLIYFPEQPPTPPSASASVERTKVMQGLRELVKNKDFVLCAFAYGLSGGTLLAWQVCKYLVILGLLVNPVIEAIGRSNFKDSLQPESPKKVL